MLHWYSRLTGRANLSHIIGHILLGFQILVVVGKSDEIPTLPQTYQDAYLSPGQAGVMGKVDNDIQFILYFILSTRQIPRGKMRVGNIDLGYVICYINIILRLDTKCADAVPLRSQSRSLSKHYAIAIAFVML